MKDQPREPPLAPDAMQTKPLRKRGLREPRAVIAKRSREKKSQKLHELEMEVTRLREQNRQLLIKSTKGMSQRTKEGEEHRLAALRELNDLLETDASELDIRNKLVRYRDKYSDFGEERGTRIKFHIQQLRELLLPTQVSRTFFTITDHWAGEAEEEEEFEGEQTVGEIWDAMRHDVGIGEELKQAMAELRPLSKEQERTLGECYALLRELEKLNTSKSTSMGVRMEQLLKIISPRQTVLFLNWVEQNKAVLHMIDEAEFRKEVQDG